LAKPVLIDLNPVLAAQKLALKYPHLRQAGHLYASIARKLGPSKIHGLVGFAQQLVLQERRRPSLSSLHLQSRVKAAVSRALQTGSPGGIFNPLGGDDIAEAAVLVIMLMVQDSDQDLQEQMAQAQAQMGAKQALRMLMVQDSDQDLNQQMANAQAQMAAKQGLRELLNNLNQLMADWANASYGSASASPRRSAPAFPGLGSASVFPGVGSAPAFPRGGAPAGPGIGRTLTGRSASAFPRRRAPRGFPTFVDGLSRQVLNNARSKLLQTASKIEKTKSDLENAMVQNIKQ
jgi:hypothetical protein